MSEYTRRHNETALAIMAMDGASPVPWQRGMPTGKYYDGEVDDYEVYFSPGGAKWHRKRSPENAAEHARLSKIIRDIAAERAARAQ